MAYFTMSLLALKWAFRPPFTCHYPYEPRPLLPGSRGRLQFTKESCVYCTVCAKRCPTGALAVHRPEKRWSIDRLQCITCGYCVEVCPKKSLALVSPHAQTTVTKDRDLY